MPRIFFIAALILVALTGTTFATRAYRPVGVVIIDGTEAKLGSYLNAAQSLIVPKSRARVFVGDKMQVQFQKFWYGFGKDENRKVNRDELIEFTRLSGCTKVLFLINTDATDGDKNSLHVEACLCSNDGVQETFTATQPFDKPRDRRNAFRKGLTDICRTLNKIL